LTAARIHEDGPVQVAGQNYYLLPLPLRKVMYSTVSGKARHQQFEPDKDGVFLLGRILRLELLQFDKEVVFRVRTSPDWGGFCRRVASSSSSWTIDTVFVFFRKKPTIRFIQSTPGVLRALLDFGIAKATSGQ
jgi:hypothetical protein